MTSMSLIGIYNGFLIADKRGTLDDDIFINHPVEKIYVSNCKSFATASCGSVLTKEDNEKMHDMFTIHNRNSITNEELKQKLHEYFKDKDVTGILVYNKNTYLFNNEKVFKLFKHDPSINIFFGIGKSAANVLNNSKLNIPLEKFFRIVSYSDATVSVEYDSVKLNTLRIEK